MRDDSSSMRLNTKRMFVDLLPRFAVNTVCDVGSMNGADARAFRKALPGARVIAFEPNPMNLRLMRADARLREHGIDILPLDADDIEACKPIYETFPGWTEKTVGVTKWDALPLNARRYLERVQEFIGVPIDMVSTGPDRVETILLRHPYQA